MHVPHGGSAESGAVVRGLDVFSSRPGKWQSMAPGDPPREVYLSAEAVHLIAGGYVIAVYLIAVYLIAEAVHLIAARFVKTYAITVSAISVSITIRHALMR